MNILITSILIVALFTSAKGVISALGSIVDPMRRNESAFSSAVACILWGVFYFLTH